MSSGILPGDTLWCRSTSVDLRNAGFKLAPVDTNLFPGGFNNLNPALPCRCACRRRWSPIEKICPDASGCC
jgi:glutamate--cysteine ligase